MGSQCNPGHHWYRKCLCYTCSAQHALWSVSASQGWKGSVDQSKSNLHGLSANSLLHALCCIHLHNVKHYEMDCISTKQAQVAEVWDEALYHLNTADARGLLITGSLQATYSYALHQLIPAAMKVPLYSFLKWPRLNVLSETSTSVLPAILGSTMCKYARPKLFSCSVR